MQRLVVGETVGYWTVTGEASRSASGQRRARVQCVCGTERILDDYNLRKGKTRSCGCQRVSLILAIRKPPRTHGEIADHGGPTAEYRIWIGMRRRCHDPGNAQYPSYGGRGITVCAEWRESFAAFLRDMGRRPSSQHSLDRIDNDRGYEPGNVRWATPKEQQRNTRFNRLLTINGITRSVAEWAETVGMPHATLTSRLNDGWAPDAAVFTPRGPDPKKRVSADVRAEIHRLHAEGATKLGLAARFRLNRGTVQRILAS